MNDYVKLEMRLAELMAQQEASGFRFDMDAATRVRAELQKEFDDLTNKITSVYLYVPGKVFTPRRADKKKGYIAGASMTRLVEFNPTSRQHIAWALQNFRGARFTKVTDTGKPKVDEATISEIRDLLCRKAINACMMNVRCLFVCLPYRSGLGSCQKALTLGLIQLKMTVASITAAHLLHKQGVMLTVVLTSVKL